MTRSIALLVLVPFLLMACGNPSPSNTPTAVSSKTVTLADDGQTITLRVGESSVLKLGEDYNWTVTVGDESIVSRVKNISVIRGAQGVYEALLAGKTNLTADGAPVCLQANPPCGQPSRLFAIGIVVQ